MDRNRRALVIAFLCVLAVSLGAATLANPQEPAGVGDGDAGGDGTSPSGEGQSEGDNSATGSQNPARQWGFERLQFGTVCVPFFASPPFVVGAVLALGLLWWLIARRENKVIASAMLLLVVTMVSPFWLALTACGSDDPFRPPGDEITRSREGLQDAVSGGAQNAADAVSSPPLLLFALFVVAVVLAVVVVRASGDDTPPADDSSRIVQPNTPSDDDEALAAVGEAAGEAADRLDDAETDLENEVYRAWRDMTAHLDVQNPETSTPAEFAAAATTAGMEDSHVETLTELFRDVRYGGMDATPDREEQAASALRAIESQYAR